MSERVLCEIEDNVAVVRLNRPHKMNAFDFAMFIELDKLWRQLKKNRHLRAVVITGNGDNFSSGLDIKSVLTSMPTIFRLIWKWLPGQAHLAQRVCVAWRRLPVPVIVAIHGRCWGAGMQLALGCDLRFSTPDASLAIMESRWGLIPDMGGSLALREIMPLDQALILTWTAEPIVAEKALEMGLVSQLHEDPLAAAMDYCRQIKERSPDACGGVKKLYHKAWHHNDRKMLALEWMYQLKIMMGKNLWIAIKRQRGKDTPYNPRGLW